MMISTCKNICFTNELLPFTWEQVRLIISKFWNLFFLAGAYNGQKLLTKISSKMSHLTINSIDVHCSLFLLHWESFNKAPREIESLFIPLPVAKTLLYWSIYLMWQRSWAVVTHAHWFEQDFHLFLVKLLRHPRCNSFEEERHWGGKI